MKNTLKLLALSLLAVSVLSLVKAPGASAATITVNTDTSPSPCTLDEAIQNINSGSRTISDCVETGSYGTDDTIDIPEGTVVLTASLPPIANSITIQGAGIGGSVIDGDGQWQVFQNNFGTQMDITVQKLKITAFSGGAITAYDSNLTVLQVDIDGTNSIAPDNVQGGVAFLNLASGVAKNLEVRDVYIHDFTGAIASNTIVGVITAVDAQGEVNANIDRTTVARLSNTEVDTQVNGIGFFSGVFGGFGSGTTNANVKNATVSELSNSSGVGTTGIGVVGGLNAGSAETNLNISVTNSTVSNIQSPESTIIPGSYGGSLVISTAAAQESDTVNVAVNLTNTILRNQINAPSVNCTVASFAAIVSGVGTENVGITSHGGNLSDDNTCSSYLTHSNDQNNVTNLAAFLAPLADNGGYVPTIPLLQGSPAIDSGVTVSGLITDARGAVRPQGSAYDSGAYESRYTKSVASLASTGESTTLYVLLSAIMSTVGLGIIALKLNRS